MEHPQKLALSHMGMGTQAPGTGESRGQVLEGRLSLSRWSKTKYKTSTLVCWNSSHGTDTAEVDKALYKIVSKKLEVLILNCIADLRCKYIFPLVNVLSLYQMASEAGSPAGQKALESPVLLL